MNRGRVHTKDFGLGGCSSGSSGGGCGGGESGSRSSRAVGGAGREVGHCGGAYYRVIRRTRAEAVEQACGYAEYSLLSSSLSSEMPSCIYYWEGMRN